MILGALSRLVSRVGQVLPRHVQPRLGYVRAHASPYDVVSRIYDAVMAGHFDHYSRCATLVLRLLGPIQDVTVLDLGGGTGGLARRLHAHGARTVVLDRSHGLARRASARGVSATTGTMVTLPYSAASADVVIMCQVLHHLPSTGIALAALREVVRVLRPGGRLLVLEMDPPTSLGERLHVWLEQLFFGPISCWSRTDLLNSLSRLGFGPVTVSEPDGFVVVAHRAATPPVPPVPAVAAIAILEPSAARARQAAPRAKPLQKVAGTSERL